MKQKQYYNLRQQHGHGEGSEAIHKTRNPHVISRLTGNPGNKDFNTFWMPDRVGHDMELGQSGRSMVEMLGTLAIMGVLSAGAIGGYSYAMNKHRTNELIYEATKRAQWVGTQLEMNKNAQNIGFGGFGTDTFGGGKFTGTVKTDLANPNQFGIVVSGLKEAVCENIVKGLETNGVIRAVKTTDGSADFDQDNCADNAEFLLVFNRDLGINDSAITPDEPEVSGEVSEQASVATEATATQNPDDIHCNGNGSWNGSSCYCDNGWQGDNCSEEEPESSEPATAPRPCEPGWGGSNCSEDHTNDCSGHGTWYGYLNNGAGGCSCEIGWGGSDCSQDARSACNNQGTWNGTECSCDSGWYGSDCSKCSGHGYRYVGNVCTCDRPWGGVDCTVENACSGHGTWGGSYCNCDPGWFEADCSVNGRETYCNNHGDWCGSGCGCDEGWGGSNCTVENACIHGYWNNTNMRCDCLIGYTGADCSIPQ